MRSAGTATSVGSSSVASTQDVHVQSRSAWAARLADYLELTKPRISLMVLVTVAVGYTLGSAGRWELLPLLPALLGIGLVAAGSSAINQWMERSTDAKMDRTANRPLPSGRLAPGEVLTFGLTTWLAGGAVLSVWVNPTTAVLSVATLLLYVAVYTPLKRVTALATVVGAVPGALPPVLGWTAAGGRLDLAAFSLFAVLFLWQFPHFLAIAWLYRDDYDRAGLRMLPGRIPRRRVTGLMSVTYALCLLPVSLLPAQFSLAGDVYAMAAVLLGLGYVGFAVLFLLDETPRTARGLLLASLVYLPLLLLTLTWDHLRLIYG